METCNQSVVIFGGVCVYRVYAEKKPVKKYFDVKQFVIGGGIVTVVAENFIYEPSIQVKITFSVDGDKLRVSDMTTGEGVSYKKPPVSQPPETVAHLTKVYELTQNLLSMDRCPAPPPET